MSEFKPFPKIPRFNRLVTVTEKLDGTNACVSIENLKETTSDEVDPCIVVTGTESYIIRPGSKNRWISRFADNYGFARWVHENKENLVLLGEGLHHGEWWGQGIQRGYGLQEKRFSLFNTYRWRGRTEKTSRVYQSVDPRVPPHIPELPPICCHVVPVLGEWPMADVYTDGILQDLRVLGSVAVPGFMKPEGIVVFHHAAGSSFKRTCENDHQHKG